MITLRPSAAENLMRRLRTFSRKAPDILGFLDEDGAVKLLEAVSRNHN